jgi:hypothetical protein
MAIGAVNSFGTGQMRAARGADHLPEMDAALAE